MSKTACINPWMITAIEAKVKRYQGWVDSYRQNKLFENNRRQFYRELDQEEERCDDDHLAAEEWEQFWGNIWSQSLDHKKDTKWLLDLQSEVNVKSGFWLKKFISLHERVRLQLKECLDSGFVPSWLTRGRTSLLQKDKSKGNVASNYRPIILPLM